MYLYTVIKYILQKLNIDIILKSYKHLSDLNFLLEFFTFDVLGIQNHIDLNKNIKQLTTIDSE